MEHTPQLATTHKVPDVKLLSVEFPGHVKNINKVKEALGGEQAIRNVSPSSFYPFDRSLHYLTTPSGARKRRLLQGLINAVHRYT